MQRRHERAVDLHDVDVAGARREVLAEDAEAAPDLEHDLVEIELRGALDDAEDVGVDEEVLAELAARAHAELAQAAQAGLGGQLGAHQPKTGRRCVDDRLELLLGRPRRAARNRAVCATYAGWLRSRRTAWGVR